MVFKYFGGNYRLIGRVVSKNNFNIVNNSWRKFYADFFREDIFRDEIFREKLFSDDIFRAEVFGIQNFSFLK